jgi:hypothetical protein
MLSPPGYRRWRDDIPARNERERPMADQASSVKVLTPEALHKITMQKQAEEARKAADQEMKRVGDEKKLTDAFMAREIQPQAMERVMAVVQRAAERGDSHVLVFQFPSTECKDSGRAINNSEPQWPQTLAGFPARAFEFFEKNLRPLGFRLRAEILNYPGGVPGDVGLTLHW